MGAGRQRTSGAVIEAASANVGCHPGGQHTIGTFGVAGYAGRRASRAEARPVEEVTAEVQAPSRQQSQAPRVVHGQTYSQRARRFGQGIHAATIEAGQADAMRTAGQEPSPLQQDLAAAQVIAPAAGTLPAPLRLKLSRDWLAVFATLATVEQRPVAEVVEECLADMAAHLARTRHALHLDAQDTAALNAYLDSLERSEREEDEHATRAATSHAMRQAAAAADERERHPAPDLEEWDRPMNWGHIELAVAID